jgi:hypothetical protein
MKEVQKLLKMVSEGLKTLAQGVEAIADKVEDAAASKSAGNARGGKPPAPAAKTKPAAKKTAAAGKPAPTAGKKKAGKPEAAINTVFGLISRSKKGVNTATIKAKTGYDQKKVSNIVYKLKKQGKIKTLQKGVYVKA